MFFYSGVTLASTAAALWAQRWDRRHTGPSSPLQKRDWVIYCLLVLLSLLPYCLTMGLRYGIGTDYFYTYYPAFMGVLQGGGWHKEEPVFYLLMRAVAFFTSDPLWLFLVCAILLVGLTGLAVWKLSDLPWVSVLLFAVDRHFYISMNVMRQYMSLAILLCAFAYIKKGCFWKYALLVLLASTFHSAILMFLPLYFLRYLYIPPVLGAAVVTLCANLQPQLMDLAHRIVGRTRFAFYYDDPTWTSPQVYPEKFLYVLLILTVACLLYDRCRHDACFRFLYNSEWLLLFLSFNRSLVPLADRLCWSLEFLHLLFIPKLIMSPRKPWQRWLVGILCVGACAALCYFEIFEHGYHEVLPYRTALLPEVPFP